MPDSSPEDATGAQDAAVASAGEPQQLDDRAPAAAAAPTAEDLDAREANFTRPRKAMGPETDDAPETIPEEPE
jgi:hypothetical protein